jgi:hypothetical protein
MPPPAAVPLTAAITGNGARTIREIATWNSETLVLSASGAL